MIIHNVKNNIVVALLGMALWAVSANAQTITTVPLKITFTYNDSAHTPLAGLNFIAQQEVNEEIGLNGVFTQNWWQFCNVPLDSTGTATCQFQSNSSDLPTFRFSLFNPSQNQFWCDTNKVCNLVVILDQDMLNEAVNSASRSSDGYLHITVRFSTANDTITGFSFNP